MLNGISLTTSRSRTASEKREIVVIKMEIKMVKTEIMQKIL